LKAHPLVGSRVAGPGSGNAGIRLDMPVSRHRRPVAFLVVEHVRDLLALIGELLLDIKAVRERDHQEQDSDDADPCRSPQEECKSRASGYDCNPCPYQT